MAIGAGRFARWAAVAVAGAMAVGMVPGSAWANASKVEHPAVVSADPANFTPNVLDGRVNALVEVGDLVIAGGQFTQVQEVGSGKPVLSRSNVMAFNASTGVVVAGFTPSFNGDIRALTLAADGASVYVGGSFTTVNGQTRNRLARIQVSDGSLTPGFAAVSFNSRVNDLALRGDQLLVGGVFSYVGSSRRVGLASVNAATGALTSYLRADLATTRTGTAQVLKFDVTPDGSSLFAIGNFTSIADVARSQIARLSLGSASATVADWSTEFFTSVCSSSFDTYMRDLDISPDGTYLVVTTTGAYRSPPSACDTWSRFETGSSGAGVTPTWVNYTGGDTTYAVEVTGTAVYVGGHFRWANNPYAGDRVGPGAVPRPGLAALDPRSGMPYSWNPTRQLGVGVFDMLATSRGLWIGHDTDLVAGEYRRRLTFFPLAGGTTPPVEKLGTLPNDVYLTGRQATSSLDPSVLYRVNTGGPSLATLDDGPDWEAGDGSKYVNTGNNAGWSPVPSVDSSVPNTDQDRAPAALFDSERWDSGDAPEMRYSFPVPAGRSVQVRLYFANRYGGTSGVGQRVFDVSIENTLVLDDFDIVAAYGDQRGAMRSFTTTSDGSVDIDFGHVVENPLVNGIEIIDPSLSVPAPDPTSDDVVRRVFFSGLAAPSNPGELVGTEVWGASRGSFLVDSSVYAGWSDGRLTKRSFDGQAFGPVSEVDLYYGSADGRNTFVSDLPKVSGMFFDKVHGRLYYTMRGDSRLLWRGFSPQSDVVGPMPFAAPGDVGALDPGSVQGMFLSGDRLYFADGAEGKLWSVGFADGGVVGPKVLVDESMDWRARGAFAWNGTPAPGPNVPPIAVIGSDCTGLTCDFRSADSTDPDGSIVARAWDFGDGATSTAANPKHTYDDEGSYAVKLTVTDNRGGETTSEVEVTVTRPENVVPVAVFSESCSGLVCSFDGSGSSDPDGDGIVGFAWDFGDGGSATGERPGHEFAAAGDYEVSLTVTDGRGGTGSVTRTVTVSDPVASQVAFRDRATYSGNVTTARIRVPASVRAGDGLLLFVSNASGLTPTSVTSGWSLVGQRSLTNLRSQLFVLTATASSAGSEVVVVLPSRAKVDLTMLAYSGTAADAPVGAWAAVTETALTASHVAPALPVGTTSSWVLSYWVDRTSSGAGTWTAPGDAVTRSTLAGTGGGKLSSLAVDYGTAVPQGTWPAKTAVAELASRAAVMWTVELRSS